MDFLCLEPATYLPDASLSDVCMNFGQNHVDYIGPSRKGDTEYLESLDISKVTLTMAGVWSLMLNLFEALRVDLGQILQCRQKA